MIIKGTNERLTHGKRGHSHLTHLGPNRWDGRGREEKEKKEGKKERAWREKLYLLSKFPGDRTGGFKQSKRESSSPRQELRIEIEIGEF